ncbi:hypothetical protein GT030_07230, partial [Streptomyces sp. SID1328]|nr:hypothetical protein [Streptomyces sp. SID1328]
MSSLPLPLALTARLSPVVVLAVAGWALSSGPAATANSGPAPTSQASAGASAAPAASSAAPATKTYDAAPA